MPEYQFTKEEKEFFENLPFGMAVYQMVDGHIVTVLATDRLCKTFGMTHDELKKSLDTSMYGYVHPEDIPRISHASMQYVKSEAPYNVQYRVKLPGMDYYHVWHCIGRRRIMADGTSLSFFLYMDVSRQEYDEDAARKAYDSFQKEIAFHDSLTGLRNMQYLSAFGMEEISRLRQEGKQACMIYSNVIGMKAYNGRYGFEAGDSLLKNIAALLKKYFPDAISVRLYGGDHFLVLCDKEGATDKLEALQTEYEQYSHKGRFALSFGVYYANIEKDDITTMYDRSNFAMMQATPGSYSVYDAEQDAAYWNEQYVLNCFDEAMERNWIKVYYQPVYNLHTGKLESMEALSRWVDPEKGLLPPIEFIPTLEKNDLTWKLDSYVLRTVLSDIKDRQAKGLKVYPVSVNIARKDLEHENALSDMVSVFEETGVDRNLVAFEVTERDLARDDELFRSIVEALRNYGFEIWVDDFGSGYSSLNVMHYYRFDRIKLDLTFLRHLDDNGGVNRFLMASVVETARKKGIKTLAEGVETKDHLEFLQDIDCDTAQGYFYSKPQPLESLEGLLEK
ncbi:MAG: GGDEF and EAL domain-containing protein [Eubacterium sp.]|nr:GGDEF and EAL domain-containing protein [Eubacterium sp.]